MCKCTPRTRSAPQTARARVNLSIFRIVFAGFGGIFSLWGRRLKKVSTFLSPQTKSWLRLCPPPGAPDQLQILTTLCWRSLTTKKGRLFGRRKVHPERENPGYAYEKRAPVFRWYGALRMVNPALCVRDCPFSLLSNRVLQVVTCDVRQWYCIDIGVMLNCLRCQFLQCDVVNNNGWFTEGVLQSFFPRVCVKCNNVLNAFLSSASYKK